MFIMIYLKIIQKEGERERQKREQCIHFSHTNPLNIYLFRVTIEKLKKCVTYGYVFKGFSMCKT